MSVIARLNDRSIEFYCKGSPEKIKELCLKETIPENFEQVLSQYTAQGFRVLGCAYKKFSGTLGNEKEIELVKRKQVESDLTFLGFFILENRLKPITSQILLKLSKAKIRSIMVTGDNIRTALSVARECELVNPKNLAAICDYDAEEKTISVMSIPRVFIYFTYLFLFLFIFIFLFLFLIYLFLYIFIYNLFIFYYFI